MTIPAKLRFRAKGTALVPKFHLVDSNVRSYVGRKYVETEPGTWGFQPTGEAEEVPYDPDYVKACRDGDLLPADKATAEACGVALEVPRAPSVRPSSVFGSSRDDSGKEG